MGSVNTINPSVDLTVRVFDEFYEFAVDVDANEYDVVNSFFESAFGTKDAAANFTATLFRIADQTQTPVRTLLAEIEDMEIPQDDDEFIVTGDLTIHGVTKSVDVKFELLGTSQDPWGGTRIGFEGKAEISRKEFGLVWNVALETGGVLVSDTIKLEMDVEAVKK